MPGHSTMRTPVVVAIPLILAAVVAGPGRSEAEEATGPLVSADEQRLPQDISKMTRIAVGGGTVALVAPSGTELWHLDLAGSVDHARASHVDPRRHAHLRPVREYPAPVGGFFALVDRSLRQACVAYEGVAGCDKLLPLHQAPSAFHPSGQKAMDATPYLRYLQTCPGLGRPCLVYGSATDVERVRDPALPPGGWFLKRARALDPAIGAPTKMVHERTLGGSKARGKLQLYEAGSRTGSGLEVEVHHRAFFERGGEKVAAFDLVTAEEGQMMAEPVGGIATHGDLLYAWLWEPDTTTLLLARFDGSTGERQGPPMAVRGELYGEPPDCFNVITGTRPVPVLVDGELRFALVWSMSDRGLVFEEPDRPGKHLPVPEEVIDRLLDEGSSFAHELPDLWTIEKGALRPLPR